MLLARSARTALPRTFGRGPAKHIGELAETGEAGSDLRLFLTTFAAGFVFVSVFLA